MKRRRLKNAKAKQQTKSNATQHWDAYMMPSRPLMKGLGRKSRRLAACCERNAWLEVSGAMQMGTTRPV